MIDQWILWANQVTCQCLYFFICKMKMILGIYLLIYVTKLLWGFCVMFVYWGLKRKQIWLLAMLFFLVVLEGVGWGNDHPAMASSFSLLQRSLQIPKAKTLLGIIHQKSCENGIVLLFSLWFYFGIVSISVLFLIRFCHKTQMLL